MKEAIQTHIQKLKDQIQLLNEYDEIKQGTQSFIHKIAEVFINCPKGKHFLYLIRTDFKNSEKIRNDFKSFKNNPKNKDDFRLSSVNNPDKFNGVLYVGSSSTSLTTRINQHLGHKGPKVFSMQLKHWFKNESVTIEIIPIDDKYVKVLYPLENALWDYHKPLFGKKGPNVKSSSRI